MSGNSLAGLRVLLTRPAHQSEGLSAAIEGAGGQVCQLPLIEIEALSSKQELQAIKSHLLELDRYHKAIFISSNAAELGMQWIERYWPQLPAGLEAFAIGPATAAVLEGFPWQVYYSERGSTSEDLLSLPQLKEVQGNRIALFRGQGGRELLAETLRARGAQVDYIELYRRRTPDYSRESVDELLSRQPVGAVVVTSAQILEVLLHLLEDGSRVKELPLVVPSTRVQEQARAAGFTQVIDAGGADEQAVLQSLLALDAESTENTGLCDG